LHCDTAGCRWGPVAGSAAVPSLTEPAGTFPHRLSPAADPADIARELEAQAGRARTWHITPSFLEYVGDSHPAVDESLRRLSEQFGVPARMTSWGLQTIAWPPDEAPGRTPEVVLLETLGALPPGNFLWVVHPAQYTPETWGLWDEAGAQSRHGD